MERSREVALVIVGRGLREKGRGGRGKGGQVLVSMGSRVLETDDGSCRWVR